MKKMIKQPFESLGPGILVTAAFIGPGTIVSGSLAGAHFGYSLLWALLFSAFATIVLQEMTACLALVSGQGLGENIADHFSHPFFRLVTITLVVSAIAIGNCAYQSSNIAGAAMGLTNLFQGAGLHPALWPALIALLAFALLWTGSYKLIEKALIALVGLMSVAFLMTFIMTQPDYSQVLSGLLKPSLPTGATLTVVALIGTTIVPYNLFLHASTVNEKWQSTDNLSKAKKDLYFSIPLGGVISIAIVSAAASAFFGKQADLQSAADLAPALQPLFGDLAQIMIAIGLIAAGLSSAITAPLATAYALSGLLKKPVKMDHPFFRLLWM
ncbi:MAG: Nramp family divalent metal transporter, partial [Cellvibrionales bacterium]|nr:Nramp family divalent metal transporter [Cellvibrionales bacterium]